jgi:hypothetical protein
MDIVLQHRVRVTDVNQRLAKTLIVDLNFSAHLPSQAICMVRGDIVSSDNDLLNRLLV